MPPTSQSMTYGSFAKSVRGTAMALLLANIFYGACQWLLMVVLLRTCQDVETGRFARGLAISGPIMMCTSLQLRTLLATDASHEYRWIDYLCARIAMIMASSLAVITICFVAGYGWVDSQVILLVTLVKAVESIGNLIYGYFQNADQTRQVATSMVVKGVAMVLGATLGGWWTTRAWGAVTGMLVATTCATFLFDWRWFKMMGSSQGLRTTNTTTMSVDRFCWRPTMRLLGMGIVPGVIVGLNSLSVNIPRYFIDAIMGTVPLGIFTGLASMMRLGSYVELALVQATQTRLSQLARDGHRAAYRGMLLRIAIAALIVGLGLTCTTWLAGDWIIGVTFSANFAQHTNALVVLMLAGAIGNVAGVLKGATDASRRYKVQLPILIGSLVTACLGAAAMIPAWGLLGAAWSVVLTKLILVAGYGMAVSTQYLSARKAGNSASELPTARAA